MSDDANQHPTSFGRYRVIANLGQGGCGTVYSAYDPKLARNVAIKVVHRLAQTPQIADEFLREAQIVASLMHPHIVTVYDFGHSESGQCYLVTQLIDGTNLAQRLRQARKTGKPVPRKFAVQTVATIAEALSYSHGRGIVHRDVKPANILMDLSGRPFLADFGIALHESDASTGVPLAYTPAYMSPEQASGNMPLDHRTDIYSLGVVLYELLCGRRPFQKNNDLDLMLSIARKDVPTPRLFNEKIPVGLERICLKALARDREDRFTVAADLANALRRWNDRKKGGSEVNSSPNRDVNSILLPAVDAPDQLTVGTSEPAWLSHSTSPPSSVEFNMLISSENSTIPPRGGLPVPHGNSEPNGASGNVKREKELDHKSDVQLEVESTTTRSSMSSREQRTERTREAVWADAKLTLRPIERMMLLMQESANYHQGCEWETMLRQANGKLNDIRVALLQQIVRSPKRRIEATFAGECETKAISAIRTLLTEFLQGKSRPGTQSGSLLRPDSWRRWKELNYQSSSLYCALTSMLEEV